MKINHIMAMSVMNQNNALNQLIYVLVTPAKNEGLLIEGTIRSVCSQTYLPMKWIIVNDGSTDDTEDIIRAYLPQFPWMKLICLEKKHKRDFASKVHAFSIGYEQARKDKFDIIGNLDADITFDSRYFEFLMGKFAENPKLGVAGTPFREGSRQYDYRFSNIEHVSGACQLFRRDCYERIGGYSPLKEGGVDLLAVLKARMMGWETRTFLEISCRHHRRMGTGTKSGIGVAFNGGRHDYLMGVNPIWQISRSFYQMTRPPLLLSGGAILAGYFWGMLRRDSRIVSDEVLQFRKREEMRRLKLFLLALLRLRAR